MGGDDFWDYLVNILNKLNCDFNDDSFNIDKYLPMDKEIGFFGRIIVGRTIPDLTFRELYASIKEGLVKQT